MKKWSLGLGVGGAKPYALLRSTTDDTIQCPPAGQSAGVIQQQHRQEHERQVVDDVVEPRAVEAGQDRP